MFACPATDDFFRARIDQMIELRHPLAVLASRMPWQEIEAAVAHRFVRKAHEGEAMPDLDLFGEKPQRKALASKAGRPRVPLRVMISLLYLKHAFNESDEGVVQRWADTPRWQFFSGQSYYEDRQPCDATTLVKFRKLLGEDGVEELLAQTINVAVELKLIKPQELSRVIVDSTVQEKAIAHPTDSRLLETARIKLVEAAKGAGIALKQTFAKEGEQLSRQAGRFAHARQFKRMRRAIKRQRTIVGRLAREIDRKASAIGQAVREALDEVLGKAQRIGARAFHRNPYDGHTLSSQLEQATILMQDCAAAPETVFVDLGYRGVDADNPGVRVVHRGKPKRLTAQERRQLKRRQAIEPIIGHLKADHRMDRCHLKGEYGDRLHAVLCAAGYNIKWLLRMIAKKGVPFLRAIFLCLAKGTMPRRFWPALAANRPGDRLNDSLGVRKLWLLAA